MFEGDVEKIINQNRTAYNNIINNLSKLSKYENKIIGSRKITIKGKSSTVKTLDDNCKLLIEALFKIAQVDAALAESAFSWHVFKGALKKRN
tara:strand:- start:196 stop:471 length:276 start_codon:yes stop_codon:yes gene_type:complete